MKPRKGRIETIRVGNAAVKMGGRLFSVYKTRHGVRFYVITEAGGDVTTVLLPEDY